MMTTNAEQAKEHGESLDQVKQRFAQWLASRKRGEHISNALWCAAMGLVGRHGLARTARELRIDCEGLKKRCARGTGPVCTGQAQPQFVELFAQPAPSAAPASACIVEMQNVRGAKMRVELCSIAGLDGLVSAFWGAR